MKRAALYSAIFHGLVLLLIMIGLPNPFHRPLAEQRPIMVEFVSIDNFTQAPVLAPQDVQEPDMTERQPDPKPEPTPEPKPEPKPEPEPVLLDPEPEPILPEPEPEPEPEPLLMPEHKEEEKPKPEKKPEPKPEKPKQDVKKPKDKPKEKEKVEINLDPTKKKKQKNDSKKKDDAAFEDMLNELVDEEEKPKKSSKSGGKTKGAPAERVGEVVTGTEIDAVIRKISKNWFPPNGVQGAKNMIVTLFLKISKDGTIREAKIVSLARMSDPVYKSTAESALRAALTPASSPLPLNPRNYEEWKEIELDFDPRNLYS